MPASPPSLRAQSGFGPISRIPVRLECFVCPATVIDADLWKLGQLKAGDRLRFVPIALADAVQRQCAILHQQKTIARGAHAQCRPPGGCCMLVQDVRRR
jgi:hypothetical protein